MAYSNDVNGVIKKCMEEIDWKYNVNESEDRTVFVTGMVLEGDLKISKIVFNIYVRNRSIIVVSTCTIKADSESRVRMAEYLCRVNDGLEDGNFEFDYDEGIIRYKSYIYAGEGKICEEDIFKSISVSAEMWKRYGNGIVEVLGCALAVPKDIVEKIEKVEL